MKVLFFLPYSKEAAGCRYRVHQYVPFLEAHGVRCDLRELVTPDLYEILYRPGQKLRKGALFAARAAARFRDLADAREHDLFFVYRECFPFGPAFMERYLARLGKPIVYDFDDAIHLPDPDPVKNLLRAPGKTTSIVHLADEVIVSNEHLRGLCAAYNRRVTVIPTPVETSLQFRARAYPGGERGRTVRLGWIGSHSTARYLERLGPVLARVASRFPVELLVVGAGRPVTFPGVNVINKSWKLEEEVADFQSLDVGLYPMPDDLWELGKASFKVVQYMATAVPALASPVGPAATMIKDGENGFLARSDDEWVTKLERLIEDPALRQRLGEAGRQTAVERYSVATNAPRLLEVLRRAAAGVALLATFALGGLATGGCRSQTAAPAGESSGSPAATAGQAGAGPSAPAPTPAAPSPETGGAAVQPAPVKNADVYWRLIEPHFERVNIYQPPARFLAELEKTPERSRHLLTAHWCVSEISNGGLLQFFSTAAGVMAPESVVALRTLGFAENADLVERAMALLGPPPYLREADKRNKRLAALKKKRKQENPFEELDTKFLELLKARPGGFDAVAAAYARAGGG